MDARDADHFRDADRGAGDTLEPVGDQGGAWGHGGQVVVADGLGHQTRSRFDFAGRLASVHAPGSPATWPAGATQVKNSTFAEYDGASRLRTLFDADGGETRIWRDGPGRVIARELVGAIPQNISGFTMRELIQRDVLGRPTKVYSFKAPTSGNDVNMVETFDIDSLGRAHLVQFRAFGLGNTLDVVSSFASGDAFRVGVSYADNIPGSPTSLAMEFSPDVSGRLGEVRWNGCEFGFGQEFGSWPRSRSYVVNANQRSTCPRQSAALLGPWQ